MTDLEKCPICNKQLGKNSHYYADAPGAHSYHTDRKGIAQQWRYRDELEVSPEPKPYEEGTLGHYKYIKSDAED